MVRKPTKITIFMALYLFAIRELKDYNRMIEPMIELMAEINHRN